MRIAFISFEFPAETSSGGIGTYLLNMFNGLRATGHIVYIFCGTRRKQGFVENETIVRIPATGWKDFDEKTLPVFASYHNAVNFQIVEGTDFQACGYSIKKAFPSIPYVVRLHTPAFLIDALNYVPLTFFQKIRFLVGGLKRLQFRGTPRKPEINGEENEVMNLKLADHILSPSLAIARRLDTFEIYDPGRVTVVPFCCLPDERLLGISSRRNVAQFRIVFIGRHEIRKGVEDVMKAIPYVLKFSTQVHFYFVGKSSASPKKGIDMVSYLKKRYSHLLDYVTFTGFVSPTEIHEYYDLGDIFVFPSYWESFGLVCFEAMAAGKAIIASTCGGMNEIISDHTDGILVSPHCPEGIANAIIYYMMHNDNRIGYGLAARRKLLNVYAYDNFGIRAEEFYQHVVAGSVLSS